MADAKIKLKNHLNSKNVWIDGLEQNIGNETLGNVDEVGSDINAAESKGKISSHDLALTQAVSGFVEATQSLAEMKDTLSQSRGPKRCLTKAEAAYYMGLKVSAFTSLVKDKTLPPPLRLGKRDLWDIHALDAAIDSMHSDSDNPWDQWISGIDRQAASSKETRTGKCQ